MSHHQTVTELNCLWAQLWLCVSSRDTDVQPSLTADIPKEECFPAGINGVSDFQVVIINKIKWKQNWVFNGAVSRLVVSCTLPELILQWGCLPVNTAVWVICSERLCGEWRVARTEHRSTLGKEQQKTVSSHRNNRPQLTSYPQLLNACLVLWI